MSWFGKILTFVVLIASFIWAYFTVNAYATRTNWKVRADAYEKAFRESEDARQREFRDFQSSREALVRMRDAEKTAATTSPRASRISRPPGARPTPSTRSSKRTTPTPTCRPRSSRPASPAPWTN